MWSSPRSVITRYCCRYREVQRESGSGSARRCPHAGVVSHTRDAAGSQASCLRLSPECAGTGCAQRSLRPEAGYTPTTSRCWRRITGEPPPASPRLHRSTHAREDTPPHSPDSGACVAVRWFCWWRFCTVVFLQLNDCCRESSGLRSKHDSLPKQGRVSFLQCSHS